MPNYFRLVSKQAPDTKVVFAEVDDAMRQFFGEEPSEDAWLDSWYDLFSWYFCMGRQPMEVCADIAPTHPYGYRLKRIAEYLDRRFTVEAWAGR